ncbi:MAG TPA: 50S ribosomal protein L31 [Syntrophorhabdales bacterium]|jgi:large subunit ribosomal protein L31|nr:50S ribosomal protein L31 [Syntrophorhabdales bacterium]
MKEKIHPELKKAMVKCACGHTFETLSTKEKISVEICGKCHPIFTGREKLMDAGGRVEKFERKYRKKETEEKDKKEKQDKK